MEKRVQKRLSIDEAKEKGATLIPLAKINSDQSKKKRKIPLTILLNGTDDMTIMREEIFGPVLPVIPVKSMNDAINYVNARPRPLGLYINSYDSNVQNEILTRTHSGGACINEATFHVIQDDLPFGGVGPSGMGRYHGPEGFKTFSNEKSVFHKEKLSFASLLHPPYGSKIHKLVAKIYIK